MCVFAGTFNPIHNAHLKLAEYVLEKFGFEKILFIPSCIPPHKNCDKNLCTHRLNMVKLAVEKNPRFEVSDIEYKLDGKSYTYLTIVELYKRYKIDGKINFIIGTDAFEKIESWYETEKLKNILDFIVFLRENNSVNLDYLKEKGYNFTFADMPFVDISSTELRERIAKGKDIKGLVTKEVEDYIIKNGLYKD